MATDWKQVGKYTTIGLTLAIAFVGALFAGMAITYNWGKDVGLGEVERTRKDLEGANQALVAARSEVSNLKVQLATAQRGAEPVAVQSNATQPNATASPSGNPFTPKPVASNDLRVTIKEGNSIELFGGALTVSVVGIDYGGKPLRDRIDLTAIADGTTRKLTSGDVGQQLRVGRFEITVLALNTFEATLRVRALETPAGGS